MRALSTQQEPGREEILSGVNEINGGVKLDEFDRETIKQGVDQGFNALEVIITLRAKTILKSVRVYTVFQALEEVATVIQSNPSVQDLENESFGVQFAVAILTKQSADEIRALIEGISEIERVAVSKVDLEVKEERVPAPPQGSESAATVETRGRTVVRGRAQKRWCG